ncbi:MAG: hypothetical protein ACLS5G_04960 [Streptococcus sp.]
MVVLVLYAYEHYDIEPDIFTLAKGLVMQCQLELAKSSLGEFLTKSRLYL